MILGFSVIVSCVDVAGESLVLSTCTEGFLPSYRFLKNPLDLSVVVTGNFSVISDSGDTSVDSSVDFSVDFPLVILLSYRFVKLSLCRSVVESVNSEAVSEVGRDISSRTASACCDLFLASGKIAGFFLKYRFLKSGLFCLVVDLVHFSEDVSTVDVVTSSKEASVLCDSVLASIAGFFLA